LQIENNKIKGFYKKSLYSSLPSEALAKDGGKKGASKEGSFSQGWALLEEVRRCLGGGNLTTWENPSPKWRGYLCQFKLSRRHLDNYKR